jgi:hypothetical protein
MNHEEYEELNGKILRLELKLTQAYMVIGVLLCGPDHANDEDTVNEEGARVLEYFADLDAYDENFLPYHHPYDTPHEEEIPPCVVPPADND